MSLYLDVVVGVVASTGITPILGRFVGTFYSATEDVMFQAARTKMGWISWIS